MLCLALKKVQTVRITPRQIHTTQKKSSKQNFLVPPRGEIPPTPQRYLENPAIEYCFTHQFIEGVIQVVALITFFNQCMSTVNYFFGFDKTAI